MIRAAAACLLGFMLQGTDGQGHDRSTDRGSGYGSIGFGGKEKGRDSKEKESEREREREREREVQREEQRISRSFVKRTIDAYFARARARPVSEKGFATVDEYVACEWRAILLQYGRKRVKVGNKHHQFYMISHADHE